MVCWVALQEFQVGTRDGPRKREIIIYMRNIIYERYFLSFGTCKTVCPSVYSLFLYLLLISNKNIFIEDIFMFSYFVHYRKLYIWMEGGREDCFPRIKL